MAKGGEWIIQDTLGIDILDTLASIIGNMVSVACLRLSFKPKKGSAKRLTLREALLLNFR
jgi:hypothetical protein